MQIIGPVQISDIQDHLRRVGTGVSLNIADLPGRPEEYREFRVQLDGRDVDRLVLWFEFRDHTRDGSCRLADLLPSANCLARVRRFIDGDPARGRGPVDLRTFPNLEPVIVSNDLEHGILYLIDGSHRIVAQHMGQKGFQDVPAFVCVHPRMLEWAYIPTRYQASSPHSPFKIGG